VRNTQKTKTNLMVFIRPRVLRTAEQAAIETNSKYNYLRDLQLNQNDGKVKMIPGVARPTLPPLVGPAQPTPPPAPKADAASDDAPPVSSGDATAPPGDPATPPEAAEVPQSPPR
jgi:general secretion pathway protein D